jgi:hypothetical protein
MARPIVVAALAASVLLPSAVQAQARWSIELRGGAAFATRTLASTELEDGIGLEGTVAYRFMPHAAAYAGWDWLHFSSDHSFAGSDMDFEETGSHSACASTIRSAGRAAGRATECASE